MKKRLATQTLRGGVWLGGVKATNAFLQLGILAILARLLSPSEFGLMGLALIVVSFSEIFNDMGFGPAVTQKKQLSKIDIHTGFTCSIVFGVLLIILLQLLAPIIAEFFKDEELIPILRTISLVLLFNAVTTIPMGLLYRRLEYKRLSLIQITSYFIGYGVIGVSLAYFGYGVWSLVFAVISQSTISMVLMLYLSNGALGISFNIASFKKLIYFGGGYSMSKIFSYTANKGDKILIGRLLGTEPLGLYERGYQIVKYSSSLVGEIIDKVLFSPIAKKQSSRELIGRIYLELTYILSILFLPLSAFIYLNAKFVVRIMLGDQWENSIAIVQIMAISIFFLIATRLGSTVAKAVGDVYRRAWRTLFYSIYILVAVYIASTWGIEAVALVVSIGTIINYFLAYFQVHDLTGISHLSFLVNHGLGVFLSFLYFLMHYIIGPYIIDSDKSLYNLLFGGLLLIIVYLLAFVLDYRKVFKKYSKLF